MGTTRIDRLPTARRWLWVLMALALGVALAIGVGLAPGATVAAVRAPQGRSGNGAGGGEAFVFRFNPALQAFEAFTIPTRGAAPDGIAVRVNPITTEVWFAETGADQIGRLIYTDTTHYEFREYGLPLGSRPLNIVLDDSGWAWFTENGRNRIGRVQAASGITHEFVISATDTAPFDLALSPDGSVWFTERNTDHIGQLVVTSTSDFHVREFFVGLTNTAISGIAISGNEAVWVTLSNKNRLRRLNLLTFQVDPVSPIPSTPSYPYKIILAQDNYPWFTEMYGNKITLSKGTTTEDYFQYSVPTQDSRPYDLDVDSAGAKWFSEQMGGKIGRFSVSTGFSETVVPLADARLQGLEVDSTDMVWFVADQWHKVYLPLVMR